jgi:hypothetical protein
VQDEIADRCQVVRGEKPVNKPTLRRSAAQHQEGALEAHTDSAAVRNTAALPDSSRRASCRSNPENPQSTRCAEAQEAFRAAAHAVPALSGHELEQRLRAIVLDGLFPLLDVLVRGEPGAIRTQRERDAALRVPNDPLALQQLELAVRDELVEPLTLGGQLPSVWVATELGRDVHQQLAVLRYEGLRHEAPKGTWRDVLLVGWRRTDRGERLLEWLRLGSLSARCFACDALATGLCPGANVRRLPVRALACDRHRMPPADWQIQAFDLGLDPVPDLAHERAWLELRADGEVRHG